ncbi:MAG: homoserine kinase [Firmicutes bacterium]|nr:homoserine kinase [Bacillota bacterium]
MVRVQVPASTANLGPGFDCLGMALKLFNIVEMSETNLGLSIEVTGEGKSYIPRDTTNVVYTCAQQVFKTVGYNPKGLRIRLHNNIPMSRGLGSSAAAIIGGLVAANVISGGTLNPVQLLRIAIQIEGHPDNVTPALFGGITVYAHTDEEVKYLKIDPPSGLKAVVSIPDFTLSTKDAREALPKQISLEDAVFNIGRTALLVASLQRGDLNLLSVAMEDRLHQSYRAGLIPGMRKVFAAARLAGAKGVALSGAGPTLIALTDKNPDLIAKVMKETFLQSGVTAKSVVLDPSLTGARALEIKN